jgi:hypothetical protein
LQIVVAGGYLHDQEKVGVFDRARLEDLKRNPPDLGMIDIERQRRQSGARVLETCTCATRAEHEHQRITAQDRRTEQPVDVLINPSVAITHPRAVKAQADRGSEET